MAISLIDKTNTDAPDGRYIYGAIRDDDGSNNGTPLDQISHQDFHQFFSRLMAIAGVDYNGYTDDDYNGFQLFEALEEIVTKWKDVIVYNANALLTDAAFGRLNIMIVNGDTTFTLPPATAINASKKIKILKLGTGKLTVVPSGGDALLPNISIVIRDRGHIELTSDSGNQYYIHSKDIDDVITQTAVTNGAFFQVNIVSGGPIATSSETYYFTYYRKNGLVHIHFKAVLVISAGAIVDEIHIPLPQNIVKDTGIAADYSFKGSASFMAPGGTTDYLTLESFSNGSGAEGQRILLKRIADSDTDITMSVVTTTIQGEIIIKEA